MTTSTEIKQNKSVKTFKKKESYVAGLIYVKADLHGNLCRMRYVYDKSTT